MKTTLQLIALLLGLGTAATATTLDLETFVVTSLKNHPHIQKSEAEYFSSLKQNMALTGIKDWNLFANASRVYGASLFGIYEEESRTTAIEAGVNKIFTQTGTRFGVSGSRQSTLSQPGFGEIVIADNYVYEYEFSITQPLLKNAMGVLDKHPLILKDFNDRLASVVYQENLETFVSSLVAKFIEWEGSYKDLMIFQSQAEKLRKQVALISKQLRRGAAEQLDLVLAKQSLVSKENSVLAQRSKFENDTRKIKNTMLGGLSRDEDLLTPDDVAVVEPTMTKTEAFDYIQSESLIADLAKTNESIAAQFVSYTSAQTAPQLDLFATKAYQSSQGSDADARKQVGENDPITVGVVFTKPLENTAAKNSKSSAEYTLKASQETTKLAMLNAEEAIENTYAELSYLERQIEKMSELLTLSKEAERLELKKYRQGRSNSFQFVLSAQERTLSTELQVENLKRAKDHVLNRLNTLLDMYVSQYQLGEDHE